MVEEMLSRDDFCPVTVEDRDFFEQYYRRHRLAHSDNSFANMVCWNHYAHYEYALVRDSLVIASTIDGATSFRGPLGTRDSTVLEEVLRLACAEGDERAYYLFGDAYRQWVASLFPSLHVNEDRHFFDYVYLTADLSELKGGKYLSIRRQLNRFRNECKYQTELMSRENLDDVREFLEKWCQWKHCDEQPVLGYEKDAVLFAIDHFFEIDLEGLLLRIDGHVGAMAVYEELNEETAVIHFEKGLPDCEGIYKGINYETARQLAPRYVMINRESDLGVPGLREAKKRYHPHHFVEVHYIGRDELRVWAAER
jgi:hypothetical protein